MAKRRMAVIALLTGVCFLLSPHYVIAASTTDAIEPIHARECTLTIYYGYDGTAFEGVPVELYKIADVSETYQYTLTSCFAPSGLSLQGLQSVGEWNVIRSTLETHIITDNIEPDMTAKTDSSGTVCFAALQPGLYLATTGAVTRGERNYFFDSSLVTLPGLDANGVWQYQVSVASKSEMIPPSNEEVERKVLKLWKGDEGKDNRPKKIEVEIFRNGISYEKIILSQKNNWPYSWTAKEDGTKWTVTERNQPSDYTMIVEERGTTFVLTNTFVPQKFDEQPDPPKTGDTSNTMLYVILMIVSGSVLIIVGMIGKRNAYEETK